METESVESHLFKAISCLESDPVETKLQEAVADLRICEQALVLQRFARSKRPDGTVVRVRVAAVDAALIHVSRALALVLQSPGHLDEARENIEQAREEIAHLPA